MGSSGDIMMTKQPKFGGEREGGDLASCAALSEIGKKGNGRPYLYGG